MDLYSDGRGLALDYEKEVPGPISKDAREIITAIETKEYDLDALKRYADKYVTPVKHATKDIVDFVFTLINE